MISYQYNYHITVIIVFFVNMKRSKEDSLPYEQLDQLKRVETSGSNWKEDVASFFLQSNRKHLVCYDAERSVYYGIIESGIRRAQRPGI